MRSNTELWLAEMFSELIFRGLRCDEHVQWKDSPFAGPDGPVFAPTLEELEGVDLEATCEALFPRLREHLDEILNDYRRMEGR